MQSGLFQLPEPTQEQVHTSRIKPWRSIGRNAVRKSIATLGNLTTPLLRRINHNDYQYEVVDGARRLDALTSNGHQEVAALVLPLETSDEAAHAATAALNLNRAPNPLEEAYSFSNLIAAGFEVKQLANELGISRAKIEGRLDLLKLPPVIRTAVEQKRVAAGVATKIARLPLDDQERLSDRLVTVGKLTGRDVEEVRRARREQGIASLPTELFAPVERNPQEVLRSAIEHALDTAREQGVGELELQEVLNEFRTSTLSNPVGEALYG